MLTNILINPLIILATLSTASSVLIHDLRLDKMAVTALTAPAAAPSYEANNSRLVNFATDAHTHTERHSLAQVVNDLKTPNPRLQPRGSDDRKHLSQKHVPKGEHAFDGYYLPL